LLLMMFAALPAAAAETCGDVKEMYREQDCCGMPEKIFNFDHHDYEYAFSLTNLDTDVTASWIPPLDSCFYPVTLPALIESGHTQYSWVPWNGIPEQDISVAPSGAFVYKMGDGSFLYKKIASVPVDDPAATLRFTKAKTFNKGMTFEEVAGMVADGDHNVAELQKVIGCSEAPISLTTEPFNSYAKFTWAAGPFSMAGPNSGCGAYVYEKKDGGIVYHAC